MSHRHEVEGAGERRLRDASRDLLVREEPLVLEIDGARLLTMRTPGQDLDFATGFLVSEGIAHDLSDILALEVKKGIPLGEPGAGPDGDLTVADVVRVRLSPQSAARRREALRRAHEIRPSCGVCGVQDLANLLPGGRHLTAGTPRLALGELTHLLDAFRRQQALFDETGGCHAAALVRPDGTIVGFGEDVGRHNALDKAIGQALRQGADPAALVGVLSGRAGYELVAKLLRLGCPIHVSMSAATALAFDLCREAGATLVGFARGDRRKVYWDEGRLG